MAGIARVGGRGEGGGERRQGGLLPKEMFCSSGS